MPFPFVSRLAYEVVCKALDQSNTERVALLNELQRVNAIIVDMRREGFATAPQRPVAAPQPPRLPSSVEFAVERMAGKDAALARRLTSFAEGELARGREADDVIAAIERGDETED